MANSGPTGFFDRVGKFVGGTIDKFTPGSIKRYNKVQREQAAADQAQRERYRVEAEKQRAWQDELRRQEREYQDNKYRTAHPDRARPTARQRRQRPGGIEAFRRARARASGRGASGRNGGR